MQLAKVTCCKLNSTLDSFTCLRRALPPWKCSVADEEVDGPDVEADVEGEVGRAVVGRLPVQVGPDVAAALQAEVTSHFTSQFLAKVHNSSQAHKAIRRIFGE